MLENKEPHSELDFEILLHQNKNKEIKFDAIWLHWKMQWNRTERVHHLKKIKLTMNLAHKNYE